MTKPKPPRVIVDMADFPSPEELARLEEDCVPAAGFSRISLQVPSETVSRRWLPAAVMALASFGVARWCGRLGQRG